VISNSTSAREALDRLQSSRAALETALAKQEADYKAALDRQRYLDGLCRDFANLAIPFSKWIADNKAAVTNNSGELQEQLNNVVARIAALPKDNGGKLDAILAQQAKLDSEGVNNNLHTTLTGTDVRVQWDQFTIFLTRKKTMLESEIERNRLRGITPQQFADIQANFEKFDANKSGTIDKKELKACLYSLGEDKSKAEVLAILQKYGNGTVIPYEGYREFMIDTLGVSSSRDDIIGSFVQINRNDAVMLMEKMSLVMEDADIRFITSTAPAVSGGHNFVAWTDEVFAR